MVSGINVTGASRWICLGQHSWEGGVGDEIVAQFKTREEARLWMFAPDVVAALRQLEQAAFERENTMGDVSRLIECKARLDRGVVAARAALQKLEAE